MQRRIIVLSGLGIVAVALVVIAILSTMKRTTPNPAPTGSTEPLVTSQATATPAPVATIAPCPDPFILQLPVDIAKVVSILYPGQTRGQYKPHGGFRFSNATNTVTIRAPYEATVTQASRYIEDGEVQYLFDFRHPCGIGYRFDHLRVLAPELQAIADTLPEPKIDDSRTTPITSTVTVTANQVIATEIGHKGNVSVDWGVYDWRQKNTASQNPGWAAAHPEDTAQYAVCWFDWLAAEDEAKVRALPATDQKAGKQSDYCKD